MTREKFLLTALLIGGCHRSSPPPPPPAVSPGGATTHVAAPLAKADAAAPLQSVVTQSKVGPVGKVFGTAAPTVFIGAARNGAWVSYCQARLDSDNDGKIAIDIDQHGGLSGDKMVPYLTIGGGDGFAIEHLVARSSDERFVAAIMEGKLAAIDTATGRVDTFDSADVRQDHVRGSHRAADFAADSSRLLYFEGDHVVVVDLLAHTQRKVPLPAGNGWRFEPNAVGPWVKVLMIVKDTDGNGKLDWPSEQTTVPVGEPCTGPYAAVSVFGSQGDAVDYVWLRTDTGEVRSANAVLLPIADQTIERRDNALVIDGKARSLSCAGKLLQILAPELAATVWRDSSLVVACPNVDGAHATVKLVTPTRTIELATDAKWDAQEAPQVSKAPIVCASRTSCFWPNGDRIKFEGKVVFAEAGRVVAQNDESFQVTLANGTLLPPVTLKGPMVARSTTTIAVGTMLLDVRTGATRGISAQAVAVTEQGQAFVFTSGDPEREIPQGPLKLE